VTAAWHGVFRRSAGPGAWLVAVFSDSKTARLFLAERGGLLGRRGELSVERVQADDGRCRSAPPAASAEPQACDCPFQRNRLEGLRASADDWRRACEEALASPPLWRALALAVVGVGALGETPVATETMRVGRALAAEMAAGMEDEAAAALAGERLRQLLQTLPRVAACLREGADGAGLQRGLVSLAASTARCERCGLPPAADARAQASAALRAATAASSALLLRLGGRAEDEGAESCRDARGDVVERAGKGLRTVAVIAEAL